MVLFNICCCCCCCLMLCASLCFWQISQLFQLMLLYSQFAFGILHMIHVSLVLDLARAVLEIAFKISSHITTEKHFSDQTTSCARRFVFVEAWHVFVRSSSMWTAFFRTAGLLQEEILLKMWWGYYKYTCGAEKSLIIENTLVNPANQVPFAIYFLIELYLSS